MENAQFNPSEWIKIRVVCDRTIQVTQYNPMNPIIENEFYIPRRTNRRLQKLIHHVAYSKVILDTDFQLYSRNLLDMTEYNTSRNNALAIAKQLYDALDRDKFTATDHELAAEFEEDIVETFGIEWKKKADALNLL